jgi:hypothetical protein
MTGEWRCSDDAALARAVAGALAEMGVAGVAVALDSPADPGGWRPLRPRTTDLPGTILDALRRAGEGGGVEIVCLDRPLLIEVRAGRWRWACEDGEVATQLRALRADTVGEGGA